MTASDSAFGGCRPSSAPRAPLALLPSEDVQRIAEAFRELMPLDPRTEPRLRGVVLDILHHPGSLARAQLAFGIGRDFGLTTRTALELAVAVEYFHTASLVFDDLPSMDNARERRGRPCPHLVFGEATATLGALALINRAYGLTWKAVGTSDEGAHHQAESLVETCLGVNGLLDGQSRDLGFEAAGDDVDEVLEIARGKTVPLIRLTLVLPAIVAGASSDDVDRLERLSELWGLAYQILDDAKDRTATDREAGEGCPRA